MDSSATVKIPPRLGAESSCLGVWRASLGARSAGAEAGRSIASSKLHSHIKELWRFRLLVVTSQSAVLAAWIVLVPFDESPFSEAYYRNVVVNHQEDQFGEPLASVSVCAVVPARNWCPRDTYLEALHLAQPILNRSSTCSIRRPASFGWFRKG